MGLGLSVISRSRHLRFLPSMPPSSLPLFHKYFWSISYMLLTVLGMWAGFLPLWQWQSKCCYSQWPPDQRWNEGSVFECYLPSVHLIQNGSFGSQTFREPLSQHVSACPWRKEEPPLTITARVKLSAPRVRGWLPREQRRTAPRSGFTDKKLLSSVLFAEDRLSHGSRDRGLPISHPTLLQSSCFFILFESFP